MRLIERDIAVCMRKFHIVRLTPRCYLVYDHRSGAYIGQVRRLRALRALARRINAADSALAHEAAQEARDRRTVGYPF